MSKFFFETLKIYRDTPSLVLWRAAEAKALASISFIPPVLDLACGTGHFSRMLLGDIVITGCDLDFNAVRIAAKEKTLDVLTVTDARALPYPSCAFNSVLANCALEHIPDVDRVLSEIGRVLRPMGTLAFTVPSEHFDNFLFFPWFYQLLGLHSSAQKHIQWYNTSQKHYNIHPVTVWEKKLNNAGFALALHRYYLPIWATRVFSLWDVTAKWTLKPIKGLHVHVQQFFLNMMPKRLLFWILYCHLARFYRSSSNTECGSGLLVVARKEGDQC